MSPKIRRYVVGILVIVLVISVGLNLYEHFVVFPQMQATLNNMRVYALQSWVDQMDFTQDVLDHAETNFDVYDAKLHTSFARKFAQIYVTGIDYDAENLYYLLSYSTSRLDYAIETIFLGNITGPVPSRYLDQYILQKIGSIIQTIESIKHSMKMSANGVDPIQQLEEKGNLTNTRNYCDQIIETSTEIINYY